MAFGIDFSFGGGLTTAQMKAAGVTFVCRYLSNAGNPKNISKAEFNNYMEAGIKVVLVWEVSADSALQGRARGVSDAKAADAFAKSLGAPGIPLYFACDWDASESQQGAINNYMDGIASVIGRNRTGIYGGYWPLVRAAKAGKASYFWQAYAWSGSNIPGNAHDLGGFTRNIFQYAGGHVGPASVDFDRSLTTDYGQWPRPIPPVVEKGPYRQTGDGKHTLLELVAARHGDFLHIIDLSYDNLNDDNAAKLTSYLQPGGGKMPKGLVWWSVGKTGPRRHVADGTESLVKIARDRNTTVQHLVDSSNTFLNAKNKAKLEAYLQPGGGITWPDTIYYTDNK